MRRRARGGATGAVGAWIVLLGVGAALAGCGRQEPASPPGDGGAAAGVPAAGSAGANGTSTAVGTVGATGGVRTDGAVRAEAIRARAAELPKAEGRWTAGGIDSRYVAHFENGELRYLEEFAQPAGGAPQENRYWFEGGELFYYAGERAPGAGAGGGPEAMETRVPVVAEFAGTQVVRAISREHYGEKKLDGAAIASIRRHAQALAGAAQDEWSALQAK